MTRSPPWYLHALRKHRLCHHHERTHLCHDIQIYGRSPSLQGSCKYCTHRCKSEPLGYMLRDEGLYGGFSDIIQHVDDDLTTSLNHSQNWRLILCKSSPAGSTFKPSLSGWARQIFLKLQGVPYGPRRYKPHRIQLPQE